MADKHPVEKLPVAADGSARWRYRGFLLSRPAEEGALTFGRGPGDDAPWSCPSLDHGMREINRRLDGKAGEVAHRYRVAADPAPQRRSSR